MLEQAPRDDEIRGGSICLDRWAVTVVNAFPSGRPLAVNRNQEWENHETPTHGRPVRPSVRGKRSAMTRDPVLAIVTVTYNSASFLSDFLDSLLADDSLADGMRVYLIDNASSDETVAIARDYADRVDLVLIESDENVGLAVASNQGISLALGAGAQWILLLNNDTVIPRGTLGGLLETATARDLSILSPLIEEIPSNTIWYVGGSITPRQGMKVRHQNIGDPMVPVDPGVRPTPYASACCLLVHRDVFARIGGLDEDYFVYFEDVDFAIRAKAAGFGYWMTADQKILHKASSCTGGYLSPFTIHWISQNWVLTARKHCPIPQRVFSMLYMQVWMLARLILRRDTPAQYLLRERSFIAGLRMPITSRHGNVPPIRIRASRHEFAPPAKVGRAR